MRSSVPTTRIRVLVDAPPKPGGSYVLYWMTAFRRTSYNFALQRAVDWCRELGKPLVILEGLGCGHRWASSRFHRFIIDGMQDKARRLKDSSVNYYPYVESRPGQGKGLLSAMGASACLVVADDAPVFHLPRLLGAAARDVRILMEGVDSNGLLPLDAAEREYPSAFAFRRYLQKTLPEHLGQRPQTHPMRSLPARKKVALDRKIVKWWPPASSNLLEGKRRAMNAIAIDHSVDGGTLQGGEIAAGKQLKEFLHRRLPQYGADRHAPESSMTSGLSPYLHFGHIATDQVLSALARREGWTADRLGRRATGKREGWWGMSAGAEAFLDQCVIWREIGFNMARRRADHATYESLPSWALETLGQHAKDIRVHVYDLDEFEKAETHDPLWNAAQRQLVREGTIHNYLRMIWGKKILEWSASPREAFDIMVELNNKYALDGRDPNSYSGIAWCLGRFDRPWGPERPIFGKIRYMSSENTARKYKLDGYLARYAPEGPS